MRFFLLVSIVFSYIASAQIGNNKDLDSLFISINPKRGRAVIAQDMLGYTTHADPPESKFWKEPRSEVVENLKLASDIAEIRCVDCIETYEGMYQVRARVDGKNVRLVFHREREILRLRFYLMKRLGYQLPLQKEVSEMILNFRDPGELDVFKRNFISKMGGEKNFRLEDWLESKTETSLVLKSFLVEEDKEANFHWLSIDKEVVSKYRAIRGLFLVILLTDWGENLNLDIRNFIKKKRGYIVIRHPLNGLFHKVHISDFQWIGRKIFHLNMPFWEKAISKMNYNEGRSNIIREKLMALLNYFRKLIFTSSMLEDIPEKPSSFMLEDISSFTGVLRNWRYYVMVGLDQLGQQGFRELEKLSRIRLNKNISEFRAEDFNQEGVKPLVFRIGGEGGVVSRYSRSFVRGDYYGNSHVTNLADSMNYGAYIQGGVGADIVGKIPVSLYKKALWERSILHLRPLEDFSDAKKKFYKSPLIPNVLGKWKKFFKKSYCRYENGESVCDEGVKALESFSEKLNLDETIIFTKSLVFSTGLGAGIPHWKIFKNFNLFGASFNLLGGTAFYGEMGRLNFSRISIKKTSTGLRIIITDDQKKFKNGVAKLNIISNVLSFEYSEKEGEPESRIYNFDYHEVSDDEKFLMFLALKEIILHSETAFLENFFKAQEISNTMKYQKSSFQVIPILPKKRDTFRLKNNLVMKYAGDGLDREFTLLKTITRNYWDFLGSLEKLLNFIIPFGSPFRFRSVNDGEYVSNMRRSGKIKTLTTEAEYLDRKKGIFNSKILMSQKKVKWRIRSQKVKDLKAEIMNLKNEYGFSSQKEEIIWDKIKSMQSVELREIILFPSPIIERWIFCSSLTFNLGEKMPFDCFIPKGMERKFQRMSRKNKRDKGGSLQFIHRWGESLMRKFSVQELYKKYSMRGVKGDIQLTARLSPSGDEEDYYVSWSFGRQPLGLFKTILEKASKETGLPAYEIEGAFSF